MKTNRPLSFLTAALMVVAFLTLLAMPQAYAQQYQAATLTLATNGVPATAAETGDSSAIAVTKHDQLSLQLTAVATGANSGNCIVYLKESVDGTTYATNPKHALHVTMNGTTAVASVTNINIGAIGYLKVDFITNSGANPVTNIVIKVGTKPRRDG